MPMKIGHKMDHNKPGHQDHRHHIQEFKRKFWTSLILTIPILLLSETIQTWLGFTLKIPLQKEILFLKLSLFNDFGYYLGFFPVRLLQQVSSFLYAYAVKQNNLC